MINISGSTAVYFATGGNHAVEVPMGLGCLTGIEWFFMERISLIGENGLG